MRPLLTSSPATPLIPGVECGLPSRERGPDCRTLHYLPPPGTGCGGRLLRSHSCDTQRTLSAAHTTNNINKDAFILRSDHSGFIN